ncbi:hypothetical protein FUA23_08035 [Neolewinella aurantiaca]|uniref:Uncharacterized protein n=1 Tax=Neolewinella aurantiaca TaxID=2602767 RepID=A0A5C7FTP9_9BACT|nr:hypothetical protein [Neolewinella aurantiaca]TXF89899.1 hypothetical protein FUA23_08035 [Neolewinella aurantiaca]
MSDTNPFLLQGSSFDKNGVPIEGLQKAFDKEFSAAQDQWNFDTDGFPAWNHLRMIPINSSFAQYLVPVFKVEDDRVKALILFTHYLDHGVVDVEYIYRGKVKRYPAYNSLRLAGKNGNGILRDHTSESLVVKFSALDQSLFGNTYDDLLSLLDIETRSQFYNKDCKITTHYLILNCQDVTGQIGGEAVVLYTECTSGGVETIVTVVAGCTGGTPGPGGPSGPTPGGGGGTGGGVNVVNNNPNSSDNRCLEDGVDCEEEEDILIILPRFDSIRIGDSLEHYPCALETLNSFTNLSHTLSSLLVNLFGTTTTVNAVVDVGNTGIGVPGTTESTAFGPGDEYFRSDITLSNSSDFSGCSQDLILSTIVHEFLHGYIEYQRHYLGQDSIRTIYGFTSTGDDYTDDHVVMGTSYVDQIANLLMTFNHDLPFSHAIALALEGLNETDYWDELLTHYGTTENEVVTILRSSRCRPESDDTASYFFVFCD